MLTKVAASSALSVLILLADPVRAQDNVRRQTVRLEEGETGVRIRGEIRGDEVVDYAIEAAAGQVMTVRFKPRNPSAYFNVLPPDSDKAMFVGSTLGNEFSAELKTAGEYRIRVYLMRSASRRSETASYALDLGLAGGRTPPPRDAESTAAASPTPAARATPPPAAPRSDVGSIEDIVRASYEVISGPAGAPRQWERDRALYMPGATFVVTGVRDGKVETTILTPEEYRRRSDARFVAEGLFETEIGSRVEHFGNVAQVRSVSESRRTPDGPIEARYVNYLQLFWDGTRWWIAGAVWDRERPDNPIPAEWLGSPPAPR
jgi:hypothetical protein